MYSVHYLNFLLDNVSDGNPNWGGHNLMSAPWSSSLKASNVLSKWYTRSDMYRFLKFNRCSVIFK